MKKVKSKKQHSASVGQIISLGFALIILAGAVLLSLPIASRSGVSIGFFDALFTSAASTCVTGLTVVDTYTQWTLFGQLVILFLIQLGGIGFMMTGTIISMMIGRRIGLKERIALGESISADSMTGLVKFTQKIIICVAVIELAGAILLSIRFIPMFGVVKGIYKAVFHSVSAFCNAGIEVMGEVEQYSSLTYFVHDPLVNFTVMALTVLGGLGFLVWENIYKHFKIGERLRLHTKLVLIISAVLVFFGALLIFIFEYSNPETMADYSLGNKIMASVFQSVSARTAGFNVINLAKMKETSILTITILMFVGGSPGSTSGGIKTTTIGILVIAAYSVVRGSSKVNVFGRRIDTEQIMRAMAVVMLSIAVVAVGVMILLTADNVSLKEALFEVSSGFTTLGCTLGITPMLSKISKFTLIILMYLGRVGILTAAMAIAKKQSSEEDKIAYPTETILF